MRYLEIGAGKKLSKVGLGCSQFANPGWGYGNDYSPQKLVKQALSLGVNHFDTADFYGAGHSERILGATLRDVENVLVATKLFTVAPSARLVSARARASAERLGRRLDLCYLDWSNPFFTGDRSLMTGMRRLQEDGVVGEVGVSGYGLPRWQRAERSLGAPVNVNQFAYNLLRREAEGTNLPWAARERRLVVAAQPMATGLLSGAYHGGKRVTGPWRVRDPIFRSDHLALTGELMEALGQVAKTHGASVAQVALAYVLHHSNVVAVVGAATPGQLSENVSAADLELSHEEWRWLAETARRCPGIGAVVPRSPGLQTARHWIKGARLLAATALEDRRLRTTPQSQTPLRMATDP